MTSTTVRSYGMIFCSTFQKKAHERTLPNSPLQGFGLSASPTSMRMQESTWATTSTSLSPRILKGTIPHQIKLFLDQLDDYPLTFFLPSVLRLLMSQITLRLRKVLPHTFLPRLFQPNPQSLIPIVPQSHLPQLFPTFHYPKDASS